MVFTIQYILSFLTLSKLRAVSSFVGRSRRGEARGSPEFSRVTSQHIWTSKQAKKERRKRGRGKMCTIAQAASSSPFISTHCRYLVGRYRKPLPPSPIQKDHRTSWNNKALSGTNPAPSAGRVVKVTHRSECWNFGSVTKSVHHVILTQFCPRHQGWISSLRQSLPAATTRSSNSSSTMSGANPYR